MLSREDWNNQMATAIICLLGVVASIMFGLGFWIVITTKETE